MSTRASRRKNKSRIDPLLNIPEESLEDYLLKEGRLTTPATIDNIVRQFCKKISPNESPTFLVVQPLSWSRQSYCNKNVERMIQLYGGKMVLGYKIWYIPDLYIEAERHAVWKNLDGELLDITYNVSGETRILFLPTPTLKSVVAHAYTKPWEAFHRRVKVFFEVQREVERIWSRFRQQDDTWMGWEIAMSYEEWSLKNRNY